MSSDLDKGAIWSFWMDSLFVLPLLASGQRCKVRVGVCFHDTAWQILHNRNGLTTKRRLRKYVRGWTHKKETKQT